MEIIFDPNKAAINYRKHGIRYRGEEIRLISARPATAKEREYYES